MNNIISQTDEVQVRALVITGFGINCEEEMAAAYSLAGGAPFIAHFNDLLSGDLSLMEFDIVNFPGGFSFGDDLGSGRVLASRLKFRKLSRGRTLVDELLTFVDRGGLVLGICNGFQALVRLGLLPNTAGTLEQEVSLARNDSGHYEDRWVVVKTNPLSFSPFLRGITTMHLPVRHGEGKLVFGNDTICQKVLSTGLDCLYYAEGSGERANSYPENPNGSSHAIAGLTDRTGRILGMMPHPEAALSIYNDPLWPLILRRREAAGSSVRNEDGDGLALFRNAVRAIRNRKETELHE